MTKKYIAKLDGKIIAKRSSASNRVYTHAVIVQADAEAARRAAHNYVPTDTDRSNFKYYSSIAACAGNIIDPTKTCYNAGHSAVCELAGQVQRKDWLASYGAEEIADCKRLTENGFDAYVAIRRLEEIERFEEALAKGHFNPGAATWCGRPDLAQKEAATRGKHYSKVWIVEAIEVTK